MAVIRRGAGIGLLVAGTIAVLALPARAQLLNQLDNALQSGGGGALPSVSQASLPNLAGVLEYCVRNSLVSGGGASSVVSSLLGKASGGAGTAAANTPQYKAGSNGQLETGGNGSYNLNGGGLVADLKQQVCNLVLQHAKSLL
jgi:hypothetical protein